MLNVEKNKQEQLVWAGWGESLVDGKKNSWLTLVLSYRTCNSEKFLEHFDVESLFYNVITPPIPAVPL